MPDIQTLPYALTGSKDTKILGVSSHKHSHPRATIVELLQHLIPCFLPYFAQHIIAGSLESANSSILAPCDIFKEAVEKKSGFHVN